MAKDDLILPSAIGIKIPTDSEAALFKALAVKWENRFQHMEDFQKAVTPIEKILPPPSEPSYWRIAAGVLLVTTLIFAGLWLASMRRAPVPQDNSGLRAELRLTQAKLASLTAQGDQSSKSNLQTATALSAVTVERDTLQTQNQELSKSLETAQGQIDDLKHQLDQAKNKQLGIANQPPPQPQELSVAYLQLFEWDRLTNARKGPASVFRSAQTHRILCAVGGPNPSQGSQPFSGQIAIAFIAPDGVTKNRVGLAVHTNPGQATWGPTLAYWGNDQAGTLEKGHWRIEIFSGAQALKVADFTVD